MNIITLEKQVCSLELARKLKELGVKQESLFEWRKYSLLDEYTLLLVENPDVDIAVLSGTLQDIVSAFTVAELGYILCRFAPENLMAAYGVVMNVPDTQVITATGLQLCMAQPNIPAKMLIYLVENGLL